MLLTSMLLMHLILQRTMLEPQRLFTFLCNVHMCQSLKDLENLNNKSSEANGIVLSVSVC